MLSARRATSLDEEAIRAFVCSSSPGPARDVETWIHESLTWADQLDRREVLLFSKDDDTLVGVVAYERGLGESDEDYFIYLVGVQIDHQRRDGEPGSGGYGAFIMRSVIAGLAARSPGELVTWLVDSDNWACNTLCTQFLGLEPSSPPEQQGFLEYTLTLPHSADGSSSATEPAGD